MIPTPTLLFWLSISWQATVAPRLSDARKQSMEISRTVTFQFRLDSTPLVASSGQNINHILLLDLIHTCILFEQCAASKSATFAWIRLPRRSIGTLSVSWAGELQRDTHRYEKTKKMEKKS
jgi:hypothetical protein